MITQDLRYSQNLLADLKASLHNYDYTMYRQGALVKIKRVLKNDILLNKLPLEEHVRGKVSRKFSKKSAFRLKQFLLKTKIDEVYKNCFSLTLTYPIDVNDLAIPREMLKRFAEWLKKKYNFGIVWKQEFTRRGRIHFHLILFSDLEYKLGNYFYTTDNVKFEEISRNEPQNDDDILKFTVQGKLLRYSIQKMWLKYLLKFFGNTFDSKKAFNAGIDIERVKSQGIACYLADYLTSSDTSFKKDKSYQNECPKFCINMGRWWGKINMSRFMHEEQVYSLNSNTYIALQKKLNKQFLDKDDLSLRKISISDTDDKIIGLTTFNTIFLNDNYNIDEYYKSDSDVINTVDKLYINPLQKTNTMYYLSIKNVLRAIENYKNQHCIQDNLQVRLTNAQLKYYFVPQHLTFGKTKVSDNDFFVNELYQKCKNIGDFYKKYIMHDIYLSDDIDDIIF